MKIIDLKCPKCGGELHISEGRKDCFCEYCGSHLFLDECNSVTNIQVFRDEAKLKELEMEEASLKAAEEKKRRKKEKIKKYIIMWAIWVTALLLCMIVSSHFPLPDVVDKAGMLVLGLGFIYLMIYTIYILII